jgi:hypothetical protein
VTAPMFAEQLRVVHDDDRETEYQNVRYWPWARGGNLDIFGPDGEITAQHKDVLHTFTGADR